MIKILVIEDNRDVHELLKDTLALAGYTVISAYAGTEGILRLSLEQVDLILLDLMLPGMSGEEFLAKLRKTSQIPVIVISAKTDKGSKLELLRRGADDYLVKPFDLDELLARIAIQLRHAVARTDEGRTLCYKHFTLDEDTRTVRLHDKELHLTAREYDILKLFLAHPQKVFSRSNLYESVWKEEYWENDKIVGVHISNLRSKLRQAGGDYIRTVWGIGFKFD